MSHGRLATAEITVADTNQEIYQVPATKCKYAKIQINIMNPNNDDSWVHVALHTATIPTNGDYIEKGAILPAAGGQLERLNLELSPGERITVRSQRTGLTVRISGHLVTKVNVS